ncbi:MAG: tetratricopeptide repeat protein [Gemmatimonadetes bacterium]|nr:tetratricopeptide repeat protein [Gemmatimonadota bacterium]
MVKFFRIKEKARSLARAQKFDQALAEYRAAISQAEGERDTAALRNLYNAAGDAFLQKNDSATAIEYFDKAVDSYLEEGLFDNAIALCHKILRHVPTKAEAYAKLGRIYGEKGLRQEAMLHWLQFAERREKASDHAGVARALREVISLNPDSLAARQQLAEILVAQGDPGAALAELEEAHRRAAASVQDDLARDLAGRASVLRAELADGGTAVSSELRESRGAGAAPPGNGQPAAPPADALSMERFDELEELRLRDDRTRRDELPQSLTGLDPGFGFSVEGGGLAPPGAKEPAASWPGTAASPAVPSFGTEPSQGGVAPIAEDPPRLDIDPIAVVPVEERIARAEARLAENPDDAEERIYLSELYQEAGTLDRARSAVERGANDLARSGRWEEALKAFRRLVMLAPEELEPVQKLVEVAQATGSREHLLGSYELLGDRLMETGHYARAADVHRRILEIDPGHRHSQDQLLILEGLEAPREIGRYAPAAVVSGQPFEYVDLEQLLAETDAAPGGASLRPPPIPDESGEVLGNLDQVRRDVSDTLPEGDSQSHYDLGIAFREMGLLDEAVREFQQAARGGERRVRAFELMGLCFMEKGMLSVAANCFRRGLESGGSAYETVGLHYHLARSLEDLGDLQGAREEYGQVVALDSEFEDAAARLARLGSGGGAAA